MIWSSTLDQAHNKHFDLILLDMAFVGQPAPPLVKGSLRLVSLGCRFKLTHLSFAWQGEYVPERLIYHCIPWHTCSSCYNC